MSTTLETQTQTVATEPSSDAPKAKGPVRKFRAGGMNVTVWKNETKRGQMFSVTISRSYRVGEAWKNSTSFREEDLPVLTKAIDEAHSFLRSQRQ